MDRALRLLPLLIALTMAAGCARAIIDTTPDANGAHFEPALVNARAVVGRYRLVATGVNAPGQEATLCSAPQYEVQEDASFLELAPGRYEFDADVSPAVARAFFPFHIQGRVTVRAGQCYSLAITCDEEAELDWERTCHLFVEPIGCSLPSFGRRVLMRSEEAC